MSELSAIIGGGNGRRRGACPTLDAPMPTGDGLLARVRVAGGRLTPQQLSALASLAQDHGNGLVEVTARGNLQVRGLRADSAPVFAREVAELMDIETGLVVETSPLAGDDPKERDDALGLVARVRAAARPFEARLGPKVSVVIDGGGQVPLAALKADVRIAVVDGGWAVTLGWAKPQLVDADGAVALTAAVLGALAAIGVDARAADLFSGPAEAATGHAPQQEAPRVEPEGNERRNEVGRRLALKAGHTTAIALPFGQMRGEALRALMDAAERGDLAQVRLAPGHRLMLDGASDRLIGEAERLGFVVAADDARLRVSACIGSDGCASGLIAARRVGEQLAPLMRSGTHMHVSGCAKGCAHPRPAAVTVVGREDGIGLVIDGRAGDTPIEVLDEHGIAAALAARQEGR